MAAGSPVGGWGMCRDAMQEDCGKQSICNADAKLIPGLGRSPGRGHGNPLQYSCLEKPHGQRSLVSHVVKNPPANAADIKDTGSIPGLGRSPGGEHGNPLQYSCLEKPQGQRSLAGCIRAPLVRLQGSQVSMHVARGSASWLSSHGRQNTFLLQNKTGH